RVPTSRSESADGVTRYRLISQPAIGPPTTQAAIMPTMFDPSPISPALAMPSSSTKCGVQAMVVPTPPVSETEPTISPSRGSMPNAPASHLPTSFWNTLENPAGASDTTSFQPPLRSEATLEVSPDAAKKYSRNMSRAPSSKCTSMPMP